jgi:hypothetical protein
MTEPSSPNPPAVARRAVPGGRRLWIAVAVVLVAINAAVIAGVLLLDRDDTPAAAPVVRANPLVDLLGWLPATDEHLAAFAVWSNEAGSAPDPVMAARLDLRPRALTLGRGERWRDQFGWGMADVRAWATAGDGTRVAVLRGEFDGGAIERALKARGYVESKHQGMTTYVAASPATGRLTSGGDLAAAANAVAIHGRTLITAATAEELHAAVDAAVGDASSVGGDERVAALIDQLSPATAIMALDLSQQAVDCGLGDPPPMAGRWVAVGYAGESDGTDRSTLVLTGYPSDAAAEAAEIGAVAAWRDGFASTGGAGAPIETFGSVSSVTPRGNALVAELVGGRDDGWVRSGIRLATPVCAVAAATIGDASPIPAPAPAAAMIRAIEALPAMTATHVWRAADLEATRRARGAPAATSDAAIAGWLASLQPLPAFSALPSDPAMLARWRHVFGIELHTIHAIAESVEVTTGETVAVLIGDWQPDVINAALRNARYDSIVIGSITYFGLDPRLADAGSAPRLAGGAVWDNVAIAGDRIFISTSQLALRAAVQAAIGEADVPEDEEPAYRGWLVANRTAATALELVPAETRRQDCGALDRAVGAVLVTWSARAGGADEASVAIFAQEPDELSRLARDLEAAIASVRLPAPAASGSGSPIPADFKEIGGVVRFAEARIETLSGQTDLAIAELDALEQGDLSAAGWFTATTGGCALFKL